jgi:hypothetical protein
MLYLITPNRSMAWIDLPAQVTETAVEHGADLSQLDWQRSEKTADDLIVGLALRYGVKCKAGVVLDAEYVVLRRHPLEIIEAHHKATQSQAALREQNMLMDRVFPGRADRRREIDAGVDESVRRVLEDAEQELEQKLSAKGHDDDLVSHWLGLGGLAPSR